MAFFKCKMCGGEITFTPGNSVETCDYCGTVQTMPKVMDEGLQGLFNRANVLRMKAEFDRAAEIYEKILQASETEAEAYWGLILCKYGVEYVEDPATYKRVPTCHRASYDAVVTDEDYKMAVRYADTTQKSIYEVEAKQIDEIQKGIVALAEKEAPYDVFICYKETDENGKRTQDSVIANDIYYQLTQEGFKVFYAAITLEDKLGKEYEPYIFSALNSAKVLLAIGTKPEYFYAVWVKNEWSRFLKIMKKDRSRILIPCFRDMDAYELPEEFAHLQAQDMSKIGFINDLLRGIKKVIATESEPVAVVKETTIVQPTLSSNLVSLIKRGNMALEDGEWEKADGFFEEVLNQDAECAEAYLGKLLVKYECGNTKEYIEYYLEKTSDAKTAKKAACNEETSHIEEMCQKYCVDKYLSNAVIESLYKFDRNYASELSCRIQQKEEIIEEILGEKHYVRAKQYAQGDLLSELNQIVEMIIKKLDERICEAEKADSETIAQIQDNYQKHIAEADAKALELYEKACAKRESDYQNYVHNYSVASNIATYEAAKEKFQMMDGYKDSADYIGKCNENIERLRQEQKDAAELRKKEAERRKRRNVRIASIISACAVLACVAYYYITYKYVPEKKYNAATLYLQNEQFEDAIREFELLGDYKNSNEMILESKYQRAIKQLENSEYEIAIDSFYELGDYKNSNEMILESKYQRAIKQLENGECETAIDSFYELRDYKNSNEMFLELKYQRAIKQLENSEYEIAVDSFYELGNYKEVKEYLREAQLKQLENSAVGDIVRFGDYKWYVIRKEDKKVQLLCEEEVCRKAYDNDYNIWENCTLRSWLNYEFYSEFSEEEKALIVKTKISNPDNDTEDYIYLLSRDEAEVLSEEIRDINCYWWLRSPGYVSYRAAGVYPGGEVDAHGSKVGYGAHAVRPTLWVNLEP